MDQLIISKGKTYTDKLDFNKTNSILCVSPKDAPLAVHQAQEMKDYSINCLRQQLHQDRASR